MVNYTQVQDKRIFNLLCNGKGPRGYIQSASRRRLKSHKRPLPNIWKYLQTRFSWVNAWPETSNIVELLYCIDNEINEQPICKTCGKPIHFRAKVGRYGWYCNQKCQQNSEENKKKMVASLKENNPNLSQHIKDALNARSIEEKKLQVKRRKQKLAEKHDGNENWVNVEAISKTCAQRTEEERHAIGQKVIKARIEKYGPKGMSKESLEKIKQKNKKLWEDENRRKEQSERVHNYFNNLDEDGKREWCERASRAYANLPKEKKLTINERRKNTIANKSPEEKAKQYNNAKITLIEHKKQGKFTRRKTVAERIAYERLSKYYPDAIRWHRDPRYANEHGYLFECDIYVPSKDAFIECQFHQSHGNSPYTFGKNSEEDKTNLEYIRSYGYDTKVFLEKDPEKRRIAKEHNLNYFELWNKSAPYAEMLDLVHKLDNLPTIK